MLTLALLAPALVFAPCEVRVIDGDTLRARGEAYRLVGVDAPEVSRAACPAERRAGEAAAKRVRELIDSTASIEIAPAHNPRGRKIWPRDRYGRRLARVQLEGRDLGEALIVEGHAAPWSRANQKNWCEDAR